MSKPFLLIAGQIYYPKDGTSDWKGCFATEEEAQSKIQRIEKVKLISKGKRKGEVARTEVTFNIGDENYDWYEIVDLRDYTEEPQQKEATC